MNRVQSDRYWYDEGRKTAKTETINEVLEIIDRLNDTKSLADKTPLGHHIHKTLANEIKKAVLALKGGEQV